MISSESISHFSRKLSKQSSKDSQSACSTILYTRWPREGIHHTWSTRAIRIIEWILPEFSNEYCRNYRMNIAGIIEWILPELWNEYCTNYRMIYLHELFASNEYYRYYRMNIARIIEHIQQNDIYITVLLSIHGVFKYIYMTPNIDTFRQP